MKFTAVVILTCAAVFSIAPMAQAQDATINTSRSNIKHGSKTAGTGTEPKVKQEANNPIPGVGKQKAAISTSRSNIKRPSN